jgi:hypothetical protein
LIEIFFKKFHRILLVVQAQMTTPTPSLAARDAVMTDVPSPPASVALSRAPSSGGAVGAGTVGLRPFIATGSGHTSPLAPPPTATAAVAAVTGATSPVLGRSNSRAGAIQGGIGAASSFSQGGGVNALPAASPYMARASSRHGGSPSALPRYSSCTIGASPNPLVFRDCQIQVM